MLWKALLLLSALLACSFSVCAYEKDSFPRSHSSFTLELIPAVIENREAAPVFLLENTGGDLDSWQDSVLLTTRGRTMLKFSPHTGFRLDAQAQLHYNESSESFSRVNECYFEYGRLDFRFAAGKLVLPWGISSCWNPVRFAGRQDAPFDHYKPLEGWFCAQQQFSRSFSGYLNSISCTSVLLPSNQWLNDGFDSEKSLNYASRVHLMAGNTSFNLYLLLNEKSRNRVGADFSRYILPGWEIHAECAYEKERLRYLMDFLGRVSPQEERLFNCVAGTRYRTPGRVNWELEFMHNDLGYSKRQIERFVRYSSLALSSADIQMITRASDSYSFIFDQPFLMRNYLFFSISQQEFFNLYGVGASIRLLRNLADGSQKMLSELEYKRSESREFVLRAEHTSGGSFSEFGMLPENNRFEFRVRYFF